MPSSEWTPSRKGTSSSLSVCLSASFAGTDESKLEEKKCIVNCRQLSASMISAALTPELEYIRKQIIVKIYFDDNV